MKHPVAILILIAVGVGLTLPVQSQRPTFNVDVDVVQILATVRDKDGQLVRDLRKEEFTLKEQGRPREIEYFAAETDLPLVLGLLMDTSMSQQAVLEEERQASYQFLQQVLRPEEDRAFVMSFDVETALLEDLTSSPERLHVALERLRVPDRGQGRAGIGTTLYDSVFLAGDEILYAESARKALIVISDGVDFGSTVTLQRAIETAQRSDAIIYSIRYYDDRMSPGGRGGRRPMGGGGRPPMGGGRRPPRGGGPTGGGGNPRMADGEKVLEQLSEATGGRMFEVTKKQSLTQIFEIIEEELRHQYVIGFTPPNLKDGSFRRIELEAARKGLTVQCREGYFVDRGAQQRR